MPNQQKEKPRVRFRHALPCARNWQPRVEFEDLCRWWRNDESCGVFAFVGIGGAGKTAIVERFIRQIPEVTATGPDLPKDISLPAPVGLFVFSFYEESLPEIFFDDLYGWLVGQFGLIDNRKLDTDGNPKPASATLVIGALSDVRRRILIVLDGLEKLQDDGSRSDKLGHIEDGGLREFLKRVAAGLIPSLGVLVTTRFPLDDLEFDRDRGHAPYFFDIGVDELSPEACITLLRLRGVRGNDKQLSDISLDCGLHALTVDLAGGYLAYFCGGNSDVSLDLSQGEEIANALVPRKDFVARELAGQFVRFNRIAERYYAALSTRDQAALSLLQRLCLFRGGVSLKTLTRVFLGNDKSKISGNALSRLSASGVTEKLDFLLDLRLVETSSGATVKKVSDRIYTVHPAIRENFLRTLGDDKALLGHEAASRELIDSLGGIPSPEIATLNPHVLEVIEEIVFHLTACNEFQAAWNILWNNLGGYTTLGWRLAANQRGDRICRSFFGGGLPPTERLPSGLSSDGAGKLLLMTGLFQKDLGRLRGAKQCFETQIKLRERHERWREALTGYQNMTEVAILEGNMSTAQELSLKTTELAKANKDSIALWGGQVFKAHVAAIKGDVNTAVSDFAAALDAQHGAERLLDRPLYSLSAAYLSQLYLRISRPDDALDAIKRSDELCAQVSHEKSHMFYAHTKLIVAEAARQKGELTVALSALRDAKDWAVDHDSPEILCLSCIADAKLTIEELQEQLRKGTPKVDSLVKSVHEDLARGLAIARDCGYGIYHIDALLASSHAYLITGEPLQALDDLRIALRLGHTPQPESGLPTLLAATDPKCEYYWGITEGHYLQAQALLLQAAQKLRHPDFNPPTITDIDIEVRSLIDSARKELEACHRLRTKIQDPKAIDTERVLKALERGVLTQYPLEKITVPIAAEIETTQESQQESLPTTQQPLPQLEAESGSSHTSPVIVLVTVNDNEINALLDAFLGAEQAPTQVPKGGVTYNILGTHGGCLIVHTICEMGAGGIGASQQRTQQAIEHWSPKAIIAVGIAFGVDETKQKIGDVLVSIMLQDYELSRYNENGKLTPRGPKPPCADPLINRIRQTDATESRRDQGWPKLRYGLVLSGQKLVDNLDYRESLKSLFPEALGGEMEGSGLYASAIPAKVDWIIVKGICDWGCHKNHSEKDAWQKLAARNAVRVLKTALDVGGLYDGGTKQNARIES